MILSLLVTLTVAQPAGTIRLVNNGTNAGQVATLNFTGSGVTAAKSGTVGTVTITAGAGSGTVTLMSVTTANGVSGVVANPTTTPAVTITLNAITPSSVAATGHVTGDNLSGINTGDQTITLTGPITGSGTGTIATTIAPAAITAAMLSPDAWGAIGATSARAPTPVQGPPLPAARQAFAVPASFLQPCNAVRRRLCKEAPQGVHQ